MRINDISIKNFRGFENRHFVFDSKLNVVIGDNTKGKTTLLHAVQIALGGYLQSMDQLPKNRRDAFRRNFKASNDVPIEYNESKEEFVFTNKGNTEIEVNATLTSKGQRNGVQFERDDQVHWIRELKSGTTVHNRRNVGDLMDLVTDWEGLRTSEDRDTDVILPLVLAFGADRIDNTPNRTVKAAKESRIVKAYKYALAETVDFNSALSWYCNFNTNAKKSPEVPGTDIAFEEALELGAKVRNISREEGTLGLWGDVKVIGDLNYTRIKYENMSSGFKAMVNIVSEIAYRCIMLNRWLGRDAVKNTPGVVVIDEVDLYLHPHWQQHVLADLHEAFPRIQFIVSTHSPFIVQSVDSRNVITLDGQNAQISPNNRGVEEILACEMGMGGMLRSEAYRKKFDLAAEYFKLVKSGKSGEAETEQVRKKLNELEIKAGQFHDPAYEAFLKLNRGEL